MKRDCSSSTSTSATAPSPKAKKPKVQASLAAFFGGAPSKVAAPSPSSNSEAKKEEPEVKSTTTNAHSLPPQLARLEGTDFDFFPDGEWKDALREEFSKPYFEKLMKFVAAERKAKTVFPPQADVFSAFRYTPLPGVKAVILGQDPYINPGEAHGLCFSVRRGVKVPPSLNRIYTVLKSTVPGFVQPKHGFLEEWARSGVFMPNATLTVEKGKSNSHAKAGWQTFTDAVIATVNRRCENVVFILWGKFAQKKAAMIDRSRHLVLEGPHPSPLAGSAFLSCNHFAEANKYLVDHGKQPIDWKISP